MQQSGYIKINYNLEDDNHHEELLREIGLTEEEKRKLFDTKNNKENEENCNYEENNGDEAEVLQHI